MVASLFLDFLIYFLLIFTFYTLTIKGKKLIIRKELEGHKVNAYLLEGNKLLIWHMENTSAELEIYEIIGDTLVEINKLKLPNDDDANMKNDIKIKSEEYIIK